MAYKTKKILVIIPARGDSKRLLGKNIKKIGGKPLISYAIEAAKKSGIVDHVVVSTDDRKIARISKRYGAEVPFLRPTELAKDTSPTLPVLQHAVRFYENNKNFKPDIVVLIQPTSPLVKSEDVNGTVEKMVSAKVNSCFSGTEISQRPEWMYRMNSMKPELFIKSDETLKRSQELPRLAIINGSVYSMKYKTLMNDNLVRDPRSISIYIMPKERSADIDDLFDFEFAEFLLKRQRINERSKNRK